MTLVPSVGMDIAAVTDLVHEVAVEVVLPRWRTLRSDEVVEKAPGELVSVVDRDAEVILTRQLQGLLPASVVVGEEATAANPALLAAIGSEPVVWLVDPIDGTANFVDGSSDFAVMVALVRHGVTVAAWIDRPADRCAYVAERGSGAFVAGRRLLCTPPPRFEELRGAALTRLLDEGQRQAVRCLGQQIALLGPGRVCAGVDYPLIAEGAQDFVLFMRSLPWDHAPGALILNEAGGYVGHLDGAPYLPGNPRLGLLASAGRATHADVSRALLGCGYSVTTG
ncbi:MAG TPA: inositol monophosphatase family protein [Mycobacteriales bacterium]|nr:inositol monophosphatase family protein [Mycobacteriales bacterium]